MPKVTRMLKWHNLAQEMCMHVSTVVSFLYTHAWDFWVQFEMMLYLRGSLRMTASSRSKGLFVAASTRTRSVSFVRKPSQFTINSFFIFRMASCSPGFSLRPNMLSTYKKTKWKNKNWGYSTWKCIKCLLQIQQNYHSTCKGIKRQRAYFVNKYHTRRNFTC